MPAIIQYTYTYTQYNYIIICIGIPCTRIIYVPHETARLKKNNLDKEMLIFFVNLADFKGKT